MEAAAHAVAEALVRRSLFSVTTDAGVELRTLKEAAGACGDPGAVYAVWDASGLVRTLGSDVCADLYGLEIPPPDMQRAA